MKKRELRENIVYLVLWGTLFLTPLLTVYIRTTTSQQQHFDWNEIWKVWALFAVYLAIFLVHNFFVAPLLIYRKRKVLYFSICIVTLMAFQLVQCFNRPDVRPPQDRGPGPHGQPAAMQHRPERPPHDEDLPPRDDHFREKFDKHGDHHPQDKPHREQPPVVFGQHDVIALITVILMLGMNLGVKLYFKSASDSEKMKRLKEQNLEQQLEYLKYQINPHFFMNTLNNIHALVDIAPEQAKTSILELSKLMRYVLYEGANDTVLLQRELDFIRNYITLMRLRYSDKVSIRVDFPESIQEVAVPPLLLISFVENAFKHGVSYRQESFINVAARIDGEALHFTCVNSKKPDSQQEKGGVGLANVRQRLNLIYGDSYRLDINDQTSTYEVSLQLPLKQKTNSPSSPSIPQ